MRQTFVFISGFRLPNTKCMLLVDMWKRLQHSNIVQLREVFTTKAFGDYCKYVDWI
jgi:PAB-dependent poly(A)-specific ribonuclease subunit 3